MDTKPFFLSKTEWLNIIALVLAVLAIPEFVAVVPTAWLPYIALLTAVGNMILRTISDKPIMGWFKK